MIVLLVIALIAGNIIEGSYYGGEWMAFIPITVWVILLIISIVLNTNHCSIIEKTKISLYSGNNGNEVSGSFFLGSGTVKETDYVYYWTKDESNILEKNKIQMDNSKFIEDGNQYLEVISERCTSNFYLDATSNKYLFHVPENSVAQMYIFR
jgi:hypothetical protein